MKPSCCDLMLLVNEKMIDLNIYALKAVEFWNSEYGLVLAQVVLFCGLARTLIIFSTTGLISLIVASSFPALIPFISGALPKDLSATVLLTLHAWYAVHLLVVLVFMPYALFMLMREVARQLGARSKASA